MNAKDSFEVVFDGRSVTAITAGTSAILRVSGYLVSIADIGRYLVIRGGTNFVIGVYLIVSMDPESNTWTLDRACAIGLGVGMRGKLVNKEGRWHEPVLEYYDEDQPNSPGRGEARQRVLEALSLVEPEVLKCLAKTCLKRNLLEPAVAGDHDWCGPVECLLWGHVRTAGGIEPSAGWIIFASLKPLRDALIRWAKDEPRKRWNLCDSDGEPLEWIADAAVQTLVQWHGKQHLPKKLRWLNLDLFCFRPLDSDEAFKMFEMERDFDTGSGYIRIAPEAGVEGSRLPDRAQRTAKREYKSLGSQLGLARLGRLSARYFEWYALRTFLGLKLREIKERDLRMGIAIGGPNDLSAIAHGIKKVAHLTGFHR